MGKGLYNGFLPMVLMGKGLYNGFLPITWVLKTGDTLSSMDRYPQEALSIVFVGSILPSVSKTY